jgi:hypothetical protein
VIKRGQGSPRFPTYGWQWPIANLESYTGDCTSMETKSTNELLGYSADARLLIINADDFGMCHTVNEATIQTFRNGAVTSCTLMVPCPWSLHGIRLLKENPDIPFGVHLTVVSEHPNYRWGPVAQQQEVPSLMDEKGCFYNWERVDEFMQQVDIPEL